MKITDLKTFYCDLPLPKPMIFAWMPGITTASLPFGVVKVFTDEGIVGIGPAWKGIEALKSDLIGRDPFAIEPIMRLLNLRSFFGLQPWGIEIALWDIIGKASGQPLYKLFGGGRAKVMAYISTMTVKDAEERAKDALKYLEQGFKAVKLRLHHPDNRENIRVVKAVRDAVGEEMAIMCDANQGTHGTEPPYWSYQTALKMARELEKLGCYWLEEPLWREDLEGLKKLCEAVDIPIAGGENEVGLLPFKTFIEEDVYDIVQPDVVRTGISTIKKVAAIAEAFGKMCAVHSCRNGLSLAANLHVIASLSEALCPYVEVCHEPPLTHQYWNTMLKEPLKLKDGYLELPQKPGLGVELNEEKLRKYISRARELLGLFDP